MSGGSYNYACYTRDLDDLLKHCRDLEAMADRLAGLDEQGFPGAASAAASTRALLVRLQLWETHVEATGRLLGPVWKAVEWKDSGDGGLDEVREALQEMLG